MRSALSSVLVLALLGACARATSAPFDVAPGQSVQLATSQSARVTGSTVQVTFVGANDSRCPYGGYLFEATDLRPSPNSRQPTVQHVLTVRITRAS